MNRISLIRYVSAVKQNGIHSHLPGSSQIPPPVIYIKAFPCMNCQPFNRLQENAFIRFSDFQVAADAVYVKILFYLNFPRKYLLHLLESFDMMANLYFVLTAFMKSKKPSFSSMVSR